MHVHRWATREGTRGIRSHLFVSRDEDSTAFLVGRFEGYIASGARHTGAGLSVDDDINGLQLFAGIAHIGCGWFTVGAPSLARRLYKRWGTCLPNIDIAHIKFHDRAIWWTLWHDKWTHSAKTPRWRDGSFHWWRALTGKPTHHMQIIDGPADVTVPMPEGNYQATVTIYRHTTKRPRWPWPSIHYAYDLDVISRPGPDGPYIPEPDENGDRPSGYIPKPGKGENAWDCGGDGTFSVSGPGRTIESAIGDVVALVLRDRKRHGGNHHYAEPIT